MSAERRADKDEKWSHISATWSMLRAILAPTGFRRADPLGVSRCIRRYRTNEQIMCFLTAASLKLENAKYI